MNSKASLVKNRKAYLEQMLIKEQAKKDKTDHQVMVILDDVPSEVL